MTTPDRQLRGDFQGKPFSVHLVHRNHPQDQRERQLQWWLLEFDGFRIDLMRAGSSDTNAFVLRRAEARLRSIYGSGEQSV